jgi:hypothetical protein
MAWNSLPDIENLSTLFNKQIGLTSDDQTEISKVSSYVLTSCCSLSNIDESSSE